MSNLYVKEFDMINPFVVAASPATHGMKSVLKTATALPGAIVMRNFGHGSGGGSHLSTLGDNMLKGKPCTQSHALGASFPDTYKSFDEYVEDVKRTRDKLDLKVKLWVSIGHFSDIVNPIAWEEKMDKRSQVV